MFYLLEYFLQTVTASFDPYTQLIFRNAGIFPVIALLILVVFRKTIILRREK